jgi:hypothetical protein
VYRIVLFLVRRGARMQRVRIEYADQNDTFRAVLPRTGTIRRTLREASSGRSFSLVALDVPFEWQEKIGEPYQFRLMKVDHLLVSPRWKDTDVGGNTPAAVFVYLVESDRVPQSDIVDIRKYVHIAWGMSHTEDN